jgi:hypothetical protein
MNIDHRTEAEKHLSQGSFTKSPNTAHPVDPIATDYHLRMAQVHATLARDEEQAAATRDLKDALTLLRRREYATREAVSQHVAKALASREKDRWKAGLDLTKALDEADCNIDNLVDARLADDGWDPRSAYKAPASAVPTGDPWDAKPDITTAIPEPIRRVLADYLAAALLSKGDAQGVGQTITFALKHVGADLTSDIEKRITELTLGADPADPPF